MTPIARLFAVLCLCLLASVQAAVAQTTPDYTKWEAIATRASDVIAADRASDAALGDLRNDLVRWRAVFDAAQSAPDGRIAALESQLAALGPVPDAGEEPAEIASRRSELQSELAQLRAPVITATEAERRLEALISDLDALLRARETSRLLNLGPSPLTLVFWTEAAVDWVVILRDYSRDIAKLWSDPIAKAQIQDRAPLILLYLILTGALLQLRRMLLKQALHLCARAAAAWHGFIHFAVGIGGAVLLAGAGFTFIHAIEQFPVDGIEWLMIFRSAKWLVLALVAVHWATAQLLDAGRASVRIWAYLACLMIVKNAAFADWAALEGLSIGSLVVFSFLILGMGAVSLYSLAGRLQKHLQCNAFCALVLRAGKAVAVAGLILGAIGYMGAAQALVFPMLMSLGLLAALLLIMRGLTLLWSGLNPDLETADKPLTLVMLGAGVAIASAPVFALIWGARSTDLADLWMQFQDGVPIGNSRFTPMDFLVFVVIFVLGYTLTRGLQAGLRGSVLPKTRLDNGAQNAIVAGVGYVGIFLAAVIAISTAGVDLSSLAIVAGALSVGIGFGMQNIVSNFVSGIILLIERPISQGDWIEVGGVMGTVRDISVRSTRVETFDRTDVIIPNADLVSGVVTNWTRGNTLGRVIIPVGVAYGNDTRRVMAVLEEIAALQPNLAAPAGVVFQGFGADSMDFEIRLVLQDVNTMMAVKTEVNHQIAERFTAEGIEIPFAQRDIWIRNPEALQVKAPE